MKKLSKVLLLVFTLSIIIYSCSREDEVLPTVQEELQERSAKTNYTEMDQMFQHLSQLPNIAGLTVQQEMAAMNSYAQQINMSYNGQSPVNSYNSFTNGATVTYNRGEVGVLNSIEEIITTHGFNSTARNELRTLRQDLESGNVRRFTIDPSFIEHLIDLEYLCESTAFANYVSAKQSGSPGLQQRRIFKCISYVIFLAYYTLKCGKDFAQYGGPVSDSCNKVIYYLDKIWDKCGPGYGGVYVDPCLGSNNPCCGVNCARGFVCDNGTCIRDVNDPGCAVLGCPRGYSCNGYSCIPQ